MPAALIVGGFVSFAIGALVGILEVATLGVIAMVFGGLSFMIARSSRSAWRPDTSAARDRLGLSTRDSSVSIVRRSMQAMSKTAVLAKLPIKPDAKDTFLDAFGAMLDAVESEEGTEIYILNWGQNDDENTAYIYELYTDGDALAVHSGSDAMKALMGALGGVMAGARARHAHAGCRQGPVALPETYLDRILEAHRASAAADTRSSTRSSSSVRPASDAGFRSALAGTDPIAVISEVKRRSPSKGDLFADLDATALARTYEAGGASCLSVLTDVDWFGGSVEDLQAARAAVSLPVIRRTSRSTPAMWSMPGSWAPTVSC